MQIYDNFLDENDFKNLQEFILGDMFPWYFRHGKVFPTESLDDWRFSHLVYDVGNGIVSPLQYDLWNLIAPIINKLGIGAVTRVKLNSDMKAEKPFVSDWHVDHTWVNSVNAYTGIFYINDNNGYTEFKSGDKVESASNKLVLFRANEEHRGVSQTDVMRRIVLNMNFMLGDGNSYTSTSGD